ncbi:MAG: hypothetical protein HYV29_15455, partial [Ignavibacteriales bacterium]|nr:hypothetical protein [Ignavibacteriales bacterium]
MTIVLFLSVSLLGCDDVYKYVVFPPVRTEYTLVPDADLSFVQDSAKRLRLSDDKQTMIYDAKDFKIEIKYLSDYHLNTYEFPDQSQSEEYSTNPFTYANWIDPELGYTPNRFTVFKVTVYNYAGGKINLDPENIFLKTDRGDELNSYGREEKNSRYQSLEAYFKKKKGTSGIDDDVFESRMGTIRRTVHYLGKPVFRGDVRDGLIVFDPLAEEVEYVRLTIKDFILGYDENNQPSEFLSFNVFFRRTAFSAEDQAPYSAAGDNKETKANAVQELSPSARPDGELKVAIRTTNVIQTEQLMGPLDKFLNEYTNFKASYRKTSITGTDLKMSNVLLIVADEGRITFSEEQEKATADFIKDGGFVVADERSTTIQSENWSSINNY